MEEPCDPCCCGDNKGLGIDKIVNATNVNFYKGGKLVRAGGDGRGMPSMGGSSDNSGKGKSWGDVLDKFASKYGEDTFIRNADYPSGKNTIKLKDLFKGGAKGGAKKSYKVSKKYYSSEESEDDHHAGDFNWDHHYKHSHGHYKGDMNPYGHGHS